MMGWYGGAGWAMMVGNTVIVLLLIAVVVWAVTRAFPPGRPPRDEAREILDRRFAAGELDVEAYRAAVRELSNSRTG